MAATAAEIVPARTIKAELSTGPVVEPISMGMNSSGTSAGTSAEGAGVSATSTSRAGASATTGGSTGDAGGSLGMVAAGGEGVGIGVAGGGRRRGCGLCWGRGRRDGWRGRLGGRNRRDSFLGGTGTVWRDYSRVNRLSRHVSQRSLHFATLDAHVLPCTLRAPVLVPLLPIIVGVRA